VTAFSVPAEGNPGADELVVVAERAAGTSREDPRPAIEAIYEAVSRRHGLTVSDARLLPAGAIPRTTSGKLARRACRADYLGGDLGAH
jgi:fatty-acyl-CoA synthase